MSKSVLVYGSDHSPWVQTVLIALEQRNIPYHVVHFPLSMRFYWRHGMVMPACRWPDGAITSDSFLILDEIDRRYPKSSAIYEHDDMQIDQSRIEYLFILYVLKRFTWGNKLRFIHAWAKTAPNHPNIWVLILSHVFRATMTLYFMVLIQGGIWSQARKSRSIYEEEYVSRELRYWCERLSEEPYFGGAQPCYLDFALLGQIQCMSSGLTDFIFPVLHQEPVLIHWLERMHALLPSYKCLHSRRIVFDKQSCIQSSKWGMAIFYLSFVLQLLFAPLTLGVLIYAFVIRNKNPARTMGVLERVKNQKEHR